MFSIQKNLNYFRLNLRHKKFISKYKKIKKNQYLSIEDIKIQQLNSLNKLLTHAYNHIPYYHQILNEINIIKNNEVFLKSLDEITKLPILTKNILLEEKENLYSDDIANRESFKNTTGGSTGEPISFMQDKNYALDNKVNTQLALFWRGFELYDDMVVIWGAERDTFEGKKPLKSALKDFIQNKLVLNSFNMSEEDMRAYIKILNRGQPQLIKVYAQSIYEIAKFAKKNNIEVKKQKAIHLAAGTVYDFMRDTIEEVFQCKAYNHYGSREIGSIASECKSQDGLHIMVEQTFVEVLREDGTPCEYGEEGELYITTLNNYSMPLIRYKIGDMGILMQNTNCLCGCNYPKLEKVTGRVTDVFKTKEGSIVAAEYFIHLIGVVLNQGNIKNFQVVQKSLNKVVIKIVKIGNIKQNNINEIAEKVKLVMGKSCKVEFEFLESISQNKTGKYRYTISEI